MGAEPAQAVSSPAPAYGKWQAEPEILFQEPEYNFVKDPSFFRDKEGALRMFYTGSAFGFHGESPGPWRIDEAITTDGKTWTKNGMSFAADDDGWEQGRVQAPSRPIWHDGQYWMFYAGGPRKPVNICHIGYATSKDLQSWEKHPEAVVSHLNGKVNKANDPFIYQEGETFYLFYTTYPRKKVEEVFYRTSTNLREWSEPTPSGAWGEGVIVWKEKETYYLLGAIGYSAKGEEYHLFSGKSLGEFQHHGPVEMDLPHFATSAWGHGDIEIDSEGEVTLYFQGSQDGGKSFQIGQAKSLK